MTIIRSARFPADTAALLAIWREFIATAPVDLSYQNNEAEFASMPGKYAAPCGCVLLGESNGAIEGCIAFRKVDATICEIKRLYVRRSAQGRGLGRALVGRLIEAARAAGYREMRLDVMEKYVEARALYRSFGFVDAAPVSVNPVPGASFLGLIIA